MTQPEWSRTFQEILEQLFWFHDVEPDTGALRRAIDSTLSPEGLDSIGDWREALSLVARQTPLQFRPLSLTLEDVARSPEALPLLTHLPEAPSEQQWLGVLRKDRNRYWITFFQSDQGPRWLSQEELAAHLSADGALHRPYAWLTAEVTLPLESWTSTENGESGAASHKPVWPRLRGLLRSERRELWVIVIYAVVVGIFSLTTPIAVQALVNSVAFGTLLQPLVVLSIMLAAGLSFLAVMQGIQIYLAEMISRRVFTRVAADFAYRMPRLDTQAFHKVDRAEISNYFFDVLTVQKVSAVLLFDGLTSVLSIFSGLLLLAIYHPVLLAFDLLLITAILLVIYVLGRGATATSIQESKYKHKTAAWLDRTLRHTITFKSYGGQQLAQEQAELLTRSYLKARAKHFRVVMRQVIGGLIIQVVASTLLLLVGGWLVISQQLTLGQLVASELIVSIVVASLFKVVKSFEKVYDLLASLDKLGKVVDLPTERTDGLPLPPSSRPAQVQFLDVSFSSPAGKVLLDGLHLTIPPGARVAITGSSGAGKSCLADLLFGLHIPRKGQILLNEHALRDLNLQDLRRAVALVRDIELIDGSVWDNLRLNRFHIARATAWRALKQVGLLPQILSLPEGLNTPLDPMGAPLSKQQLHLLMLARAIAASPNVLVIDGLLDDLEPSQLQIVLQHLTHPDNPWTLIVMSTHPHVLEACDFSYTLPSKTPAPTYVPTLPPQPGS